MWGSGVALLQLTDWWSNPACLLFMTRLNLNYSRGRVSAATGKYMSGCGLRYQLLTVNDRECLRRTEVGGFSLFKLAALKKGKKFDV